MRGWQRGAIVGLFLLAAGGCKPRGRVVTGWGFPPVPTQAPTAAPLPPPVAVPAPAPGGYQGLGVESVPPEVLARHAAPPLKPEQSRRIQAMLDLRAPAAGMVSPDGKKLFFGWTITGTPQVFRVDGPMTFPTQLTGGEDPTRLVGVTPDGRWLLIARDRNGEENPGLYLLAADGGALEVIQHKPKVQTQLNWIADDGSWLYYRANDVTADSYAIYRYDIAARKAELVFGEPGIWSVADVDKDKLLLQKDVGSNMAEFYAYDPSSKKLEHVIGKGEREDYQAAFGAGGEIVVLTPKLGEFRRLYLWKEGKLEPISPDIAHDVSGFSIDRARKRILYSVNEGGYAKLFGLSATSKQPLKLPKLPAADHVWLGATSMDGRYTALMVDSGTAPPQSYIYDWRTETLTRWHKPSSPELDTTKFARVTLESYPARDGTSIPLFVRRPAQCVTPKTPCPVIVSFHGGPEAQAIAGFSTRAQMFVDAGFVYAEPNVRGSDGYGKSWIHADDGDKRLAVITDIEDASRFVRDKWAVGGVKPKVGIYGGSYGGYSVLMGMTMFAGAYDVGVSVVGISSLLTFLENTAPYRRILRISEYGDPEKQRAALEQLSPITHVDKVSAPLMLLQGATDPRVPAGEALQFHEALKKKSIPTELIIFPDEGHGFQKRPNQVLAMGHTIRFFEQHLR